MARLCLTLAALAALAGCSLIVEQRGVQCQSDADCAEFGPHPFCQAGVCIDSGLGPAGCFFGKPSSDTEYLNQCSTGCVPFDNCARLGLCDGAELPPLLPRP